MKLALQKNLFRGEIKENNNRIEEAKNFIEKRFLEERELIKKEIET